jgi:hypothetical protein
LGQSDTFIAQFPLDELARRGIVLSNAVRAIVQRRHPRCREHDHERMSASS